MVLFFIIVIVKKHYAFKAMDWASPKSLLNFTLNHLDGQNHLLAKPLEGVF
jgi:hypothetical protein